MSFLDTEPALIHRLDSRGAWNRFRVADPRQQASTLRELWRGGVPISIGAAGGPTVVAVLWAVDETHGDLHFSLPPDAPDLAEFGAQPLWAAGYLGDVKLQFDVRHARLERQAGGCMLRAAAPQRFYSLPRRGDLRVKRALAQSPLVQFRHPLAGDVSVTLRALDISMSGCALLTPADTPQLQQMPPLPPGAAIKQVEVQLDDVAIFFTDLSVQHVTFSAASRGGTRIGCAWQQMPASSAATLAQWIGQGRRRRGMVSLAFD